MSQWGKLDRLELNATLTANLDSTTVTLAAGDGLTGSANIKAGDSLVIANVAYRVANVVNANTYTLDVAYTGANTAGLSFAVQQSPKDIGTYGWANTAGNGANLVNKRNVFGVDRVEAANQDNKNRGFNSPGWVHYKEWVNTQGSTRRRVETLVSMSKNFNIVNVDVYNAPGLDAYDDGNVYDYGAYFSVLPYASKVANAHPAANASAIYTFTAETTPSGGALTYKWEISQDQTTWYPLSANSVHLNTGNTSTTLTLTNVYSSGYTINSYVRANVTANGTSVINTSPSVKIVTLSGGIA